ncbi:neuromedin-U receptor 2-like [Biomphalaria glabrata]|uniref:Neuromedin-U receptor 2-like n=1 Tax=Biomphalaria glabrata TaxID=6526 RepID=A0A9U8EHP9_BIOGL|nr:neuromedin-U receptor 2-like [Biomphalaria glabrata]
MKTFSEQLNEMCPNQSRGDTASAGNNTFDSVTEVSKKAMMSPNSDIFDDFLLEALRVAFIFPANFILSVVGVLTNIFNMLVQMRLGLKSSMAIGIFALSMTDLVVTFLQLVISVCYVLDKIYPDYGIDFWAVGVFVFSWARYMFFFVSGWITTTISIERCFCVVSPFQVRTIFTKKRCVAAILFIYAVHFSLIVPIYAVQKLIWTSTSSCEDNQTATSVFTFTIVFTEEFIDVQVILNNVYAIALSVTSQCIIIVCTIWMIYSLKSSARVRVDENQAILTKPNFTVLSERERRMVKVVLGLVILLTSCNIPRYAIICVYYFLPGMNAGSYKNLSDFLWDISDLLSVINCSSNFFVYLLLNVNFKKTLATLFN